MRTLALTLALATVAGGVSGQETLRPYAVVGDAIPASLTGAPGDATRGRASFLGERALGHVDPGSRSMALIIAAICDSL